MRVNESEKIDAGASHTAIRSVRSEWAIKSRANNVACRLCSGRILTCALLTEQLGALRYILITMWCEYEQLSQSEPYIQCHRSQQILAHERR